MSFRHQLLQLLHFLRILKQQVLSFTLVIRQIIQFFDPLCRLVHVQTHQLPAILIDRLLSALLIKFIIQVIMLCLFLFPVFQHRKIG